MMLLFITQNFSDLFILGFFASESVLGLIPPDIFIAWTKIQKVLYSIYLF